MRDCEAIRDELKAFADGELPWGTRRAVRRHVATCAACREELEAMEKIGHHLRTEDVGALNPALRTRILAGLPERATAPPPVSGEALPRRRWMEVAAVVGVGVVGVMAVIMYPGVSMSPPTEANKSVFNAGGGRAASAPMPAKAENQRMASAKGSDDVFNREQQAGGGGTWSNTQAAGRVAEAPSAAPPAAVTDTGATDAPAQGVLSYGSPTGNMPAGGPAASRPAAAKSPGVMGQPQAGMKFYGGDTKAGEASRTRTVAAPQRKEMARQVRKVADITVEVEGLERKNDAVEGLVKSAGGFVANSRLATGDDGLKYASLTLRVPVTRFESVMRDVAKLGDVKAKSVNGDDVTEEISDHKRAVSELKSEVKARSQALRAKSSGKAATRRPEDTTALRVQKAQAEGRIELLKKQSAMATITVQLKEKPKPRPPKQAGFLHDLKGAAGAAGDTFLETVRVLVLVLLWLIAYAPLWLPAAFLIRIAARHYRRRAAYQETQVWRAKWAHPTGPDAQA
jgi:hypothetical protein